ncbi:MAG: hypothetical protein ACLFUH_00890, partial [Bacteroidales bacterium]
DNNNNNLKRSLICKYDNLNQSKIMKGEILKTEYDQNRMIIHRLYDNYLNISISQIVRELEMKTINLFL